MTDAIPYLVPLDPLLDDEERLTWRAAHAFGTSRIAPIIDAHYEAGTFPMDLVPELAKMGFLGGPLTGYGCAGQNPVAYGLTMLELERQDSGIRSFCSVQTALVMWPIWAYGSDAQKDRFLPGMQRGEIIGCFGLTEPNSGSDPASMGTVATQDGPGGDFILRGQKQWITNSPLAHVCLVWAKTLEHGSDTPVVRGFLVERDMAGLSTPEQKGKLSLRASITGEIILDDVRVPAANMLPGVTGLKGPLSCLTQARYGIGWGGLGIAMDVYERARRYALERTQFGRPLASFQLTQAKLVELHNEIGKGVLLAHHFGRLKERDRLDAVQVSYLKRDLVALARNAASTARSILGANGISTHFAVMRHMCNVEAVYTYEGTHEVHTLSIGRALTGHSAFVG